MNPWAMLLLGAVLGVVVGAIVGYLLARAGRTPAAGGEQARVDELRRQVEQERRASSVLRDQIVAAESARSAAEARAAEVGKKLDFVWRKHGCRHL